MTVQAQNSVQYYKGPIEIGTELSIVEFTFIDNSHVSAKVRGNTEVWKYGYDYIISGAQTLIRTITVQRRVAENEVLAVYLDVPITQNISPEEGGNFPASTNEYVLDKLTYISQMLDERLKRSLQISIDTPFSGTLPAPEPNKALKISPDGSSFVMSDYDPDIILPLTEDFKNKAQQAAIEALASQNIATEQANTATEQANIATQQATIATNKTSEVVASGNEALSNIDTAKNNAITSITNQETTSKNNIINEGATQVGLVKQEGAARVEEILETGCIDVEYTEGTSTLTFTGGGSVLLSNYYTKKETNELIPTNNNQLVNGAGYITANHHDSTKQDVITDLETIREGASKGSTALQAETDPVYTTDKPNLALKSEIPTKVSSFTNDVGYQTATDVAGMIASIPQFEIKIVNELPATGQKMVLYLLPKTSASGDDIYDEYIWIEGTSSFELVGSTTVDLSDYYTKTDTDGLLELKQDKLTAGTGISISDNTISNAFTTLDSYTKYSDDNLTGSQAFIYKSVEGSYLRGNFTNFVDSLIKPKFALKSEIPTKTSQLTNDNDFITSSYHDNTKQDVITDLETIIAGASKGATALQSIPPEYVTETELNDVIGNIESLLAKV